MVSTYMIAAIACAQGRKSSCHRLQSHVFAPILTVRDRLEVRIRYCSALRCLTRYVRASSTVEAIFFLASSVIGWLSLRQVERRSSNHSSITSLTASSHAQIGSRLAHRRVLLNDSAALEVRLMKREQSDPSILRHITRAHLSGPISINFS